MPPPPPHPWARAPRPASVEPPDAFDEAKESPLVDTLVEGGVVLVIAALVNVAFWGVVRFGFVDGASFLAEVA